MAWSDSTIKGRSLSAINSLKNPIFRSPLTHEIDIKPGWHINAHKPLQPYLLPTEISIGEGTKGWQLTDVNYPEPVKKKLGFQREELALYENGLKLRGKLLKSTQAEQIFFLKINLQACDEKICLPPEKLLLRIPVTEKAIRTLKD